MCAPALMWTHREHQSTMTTLGTAQTICRMHQDGSVKSWNNSSSRTHQMDAMSNSSHRTAKQTRRERQRVLRTAKTYQRSCQKHYNVLGKCQSDQGRKTLQEATDDPGILSGATAAPNYVQHIQEHSTRARNEHVDEMIKQS